MQQNQSPIPQEKLSFLNTLLDKELDMLKYNNVPSYLQKTQPSSYFEQESIQQSSIRALSNNPTSQTKRTTNGDLNEIQDKIITIEARIQKNIEKQIQPNQLVQQQEVKDSDEETPLKNKYNHNQSSHKKQIKFTEQEHSTKTLNKSSFHDERKNKFQQLEKNIESAENKLSQSKAQRKSLSQAKSKSKEKSQTSLQRGISTQQQDVQSLQIKVSQLRKQWEDDRAQLIKEKQKNQQMQSQIDQLNKKLKKVLQQNEKFSQIEQEQQRLQENFEKSEFIRQQQKQLIQTLKQEIEELKSNNNNNNQPNNNIKNKSKKRGLEDNSNKYLNK
ncbi:unnamed protein product [Paramecium sonneborni]|uniref:Uncharacterized protein n=1 Tax=Paramecium sonneborni TaxID=65129 RepID=A0A8S1QGI1_9CILI|nr:unnamed protein product [Paramecium sonneborni]